MKAGFSPGLEGIRRPQTTARANTSARQVEYFLSPFDFLKYLLTFFLLRAAFKRFVLPRCFILIPFRIHSVI
jgi:hypothetical protein